MASSHDYMLFFTELGRCFWLKVYEIPEGTRTSKGRAIQNLVAIPREDRVRAYINIPDFTDEDFINSHYLVFCTRKGVIKKTLVEQFSRPRTNGINAINIRDEDTLLEVRLTNGSCYIVMALKSGKAIRFHEDAVREMGRTATGVRGVRLNDDKDDAVVGMVCVDKSEIDDIDVLVLSENGYGKRSPLPDYPITNRGGKGVKTMQITEKTGKLIGLSAVTKEHDLMIITESGIAIRTAVSAISQLGRATQGVRVIRLGEGEVIASIAKLDPEEEIDTESIENEQVSDSTESNTLAVISEVDEVPEALIDEEDDEDEDELESDDDLMDDTADDESEDDTDEDN